MSLSGTINRARFDGGLFDRIQNVAVVAGGTTSMIVATGVSHTNAGSGNKSFAASGGTLSATSFAGNDSANVGP